MAQLKYWDGLDWVNAVIGAQGPTGPTGLTGPAGTTDYLQLINTPDFTPYATKVYADNAATTAVAAVIDAAPSTLDTLNELAAAINDDASFASTITASLGYKAPIDSPTFTGTVSGITKAMVGLGSVDNTTDVAKPVSTATQSALDLKASISGIETLTNKSISGSTNTLSNIPNSALTNSSITVNGSSVSLGGSLTLIALPVQTGSAGEMLITDGTDASWTNTITANSTTSVGLIVKGLASQTEDLQEWHNSSGTVLSKIDSLGNISVPSATVIGTQIISDWKVRNTYASISAPTGGNDGDVWLVYTA